MIIIHVMLQDLPLKNEQAILSDVTEFDSPAITLSGHIVSQACVWACNSQWIILNASYDSYQSHMLFKISFLRYVAILTTMQIFFISYVI